MGTSVLGPKPKQWTRERKILMRSGKGKLGCLVWMEFQIEVVMQVQWPLATREHKFRRVFHERGLLTM